MAKKTYINYLFIVILILAIIIGIFIPLSFFNISPKMQLISFLSSFVIAFCITFLLGYNPEKFNEFINKINVLKLPLFPISEKNLVRWYRIIGYGGAIFMGFIILFIIMSLIIFK